MDRSLNSVSHYKGFGVQRMWSNRFDVGEKNGNIETRLVAVPKKDWGMARSIYGKATS